MLPALYNIHMPTTVGGMSGQHSILNNKKLTLDGFIKLSNRKGHTIPRVFLRVNSLSTSVGDAILYAKDEVAVLEYIKPGVVLELWTSSPFTFVAFGGTVQLMVMELYPDLSEPHDGLSPVI